MPPRDPSLPINRQSVRLAGFDYALPHDYFVTICTDSRRLCLGRIEADLPVLSELGCAVDACWRAIPDHIPRASLDEHVVMPNHIHGIVSLRGVPPGWDVHGPLQYTKRRSTFGAVTPGSLPAVLRSFKAAATSAARQRLNDPAYTLWQRGYHDHIIRNDRERAAIIAYIRDNPRRWRLDRENPDGDGTDDVVKFMRSLADL